MYRASFIQRVMVVGLLAALVAGGSAFAERGDRGGRGGDGGGRSSSGDGGSRSYSRGGGGGGESRSYSRGGGGSSRSGGESRSFSRGDSGSSSRSMPSRSFSRGDSGQSSQTFRSDSGSSRQYRPSDGGSSRSFSPQSRDAFQGTRSGQESGRSIPQQFRSSNRPDSDRSTFDPSSRGTFRSDQPGGRTADSGDRSTEGQRRVSQGGQSDRGPQQYQARRANEEQVREFLQLRGDSSQRQADARGEMRDGRSVRGDSDEQRRADVARRLDETKRNTVNRNIDDASRINRDSRDVRDGNRDRDFDRDRDFNRDRDLANRGNRDGNDRDYQRWREGAGSRDRDDDHRDWSGKWRDGDRFDSARHIRNDWHGRHDHPFDADWWTGHDRWHGHHGNWWGHHAHRHNRPFYWWTWATVPLVSDWFSFGWNRPYYWDYGPGEYIYYDDGVVYVNGRWHQPAPVFYDRTVEIVERAPDLTPEESAQLKWLPLGVFAVTPDGAAQADVLVQLAVTQDGVIGGTASDQRSGTAYAIEGMVDKQTQRAVWSYTNERNQRIVMETSIYNLTQSEATGLVHYGPNDFRVVQLVRLEDPGAGTPSATNGSVGELPTP